MVVCNIGDTLVKLSMVIGRILISIRQHCEETIVMNVLESYSDLAVDEKVNQHANMLRNSMGVKVTTADDRC